VIVVIALLLGVDPSSVISQQPGTQSAQTPGFDVSQCKTGADANNILDCRVVATGNSVDAVWAQLMPDYTRPKLQLFTDAVNTGCGTADSAVGPFYCPPDQTVYIDTSFYQVLEDQFGSSGGKLAQEYVVAHEYGHHVQNLLGDIGKAQQGAQGAEGNGVRTELQADCYAGVWAHFAAITKQPGTDVTFLEPLTDKDIADALSAAASVGDDAIQQKSTGQVNPDSWTHGSSAERQKWFTVGYQTGDPKQCDTYNATNLG
jgi:predicted metalloprotease